MGAEFILPMLSLGEFTLILVTLGLGIVIEALALAIWGTDPVALPSLFEVETIRVGGAYLTIDSILIVAMILIIWCCSACSSATLGGDGRCAPPRSIPRWRHHSASTCR